MGSPVQRTLLKGPPTPVSSSWNFLYLLPPFESDVFDCQEETEA